MAERYPPSQPWWRKVGRALSASPRLRREGMALVAGAIAVLALGINWYRSARQSDY